MLQPRDGAHHGLLDVGRQAGGIRADGLAADRQPVVAVEDLDDRPRRVVLSPWIVDPVESFEVYCDHVKKG